MVDALSHGAPCGVTARILAATDKALLFAQGIISVRTHGHHDQGQHADGKYMMRRFHSALAQ